MPQIGGLSDRDFTFRGMPYTIRVIAVKGEAGGSYGDVLFSLTSRLPADDRPDLVLYAGDTSLSFVHTGGTGGTYIWQSDVYGDEGIPTLGPGQDWSMETAVTLRLRENAAPVFTSSATISVDENETAVVTVTATDADPGDNYLRFRTSGGEDRGRFEINVRNGTLSFKSAPNFEDPQDEGADNVYEVEVEARSGEDRQAGAEQHITNKTRQTITVTVTDVSEKSAKPAKPELKADADSTTSLRVNWKKPDLNGGPEITDYNVAHRAYQEGTDGEWTDGDYDGTALTAIITGLDADTDYEARVQADNDELPSDWSDPSEPFSPKSCARNAGDLWCGVVTVEGVQGNTAHGFLGIAPFDGGDLDGNPEDKMFLVYTINGVYVGTTGDASGNLHVILNLPLSDDDRATLALHVDGRSEPFAFSAASKASLVTAYAWSGAGLNWSSESTVTLRLRRKAAPPMLSIANARADEGDAVAFVVTLSEEVGAAVTVDWTASLVAGVDTAETGDFTAATGTLTFSASTSQKTATFTVATAQNDDEDDETFTVTLSNRSPPWVQLPTATATGTIRDDDGLPEVTIAADPDTVTEGTDAVFTLSRTGSTAAALTVTVEVEVSQTEDVLADAESDWPSSVTFAADAADATLTLATKDDDTNTGDGTVTVTLPAGTGYEVGTENAATVTVSDNDDNAAPSFTSSATFDAAENQTTAGHGRGVGRRHGRQHHRLRDHRRRGPGFLLDRGDLRRADVRHGTELRGRQGHCERRSGQCRRQQPVRGGSDGDQRRGRARGRRPPRRSR